MVKITITGDTPLEALSHLTAMGIRATAIPEVYEAANRIMAAEVKQENKTQQTAPEAVPAATLKAAPTCPSEAAAPVAPAAPEPAPVAPEPAPVAPVAPDRAYTAEEIARAIAAHLTTRPESRPELLKLLQAYQLASINDLKPEQCGSFATALRDLGVDI